MRTRTLGDGGPEVTVVGLGCNNFGAPRRPRADARRDRRGARRGHHALRHRRHLLARGRARSTSGEVLEGRRDRVVLATKFGKPIDGAPELPRGSRDYIRWAVEGSLRAPAHRRDRPLPDARARSGARRSRRRSARSHELVQRGQGAVHRLVQLLAGADRGGGPHRARARARRASSPRRTEYSFVAPRGRGRAAADVRAARDRRAPVLPARERPAHRQVRARRGGDRGPARRPRDPGRAVRPGRGAAARSPTSAASRCSTSRSAGSPRCRRSRR